MRADANGVVELVERQLEIPSTSWSVGVLGAIAEFHRGAGESCTRNSMSAVTARGAIRLDIAPATRAIAYEIVAQRIDSWNHGVALCLPRGACGMHRRRAISEIGPDAEAIRLEDREAILFDLGLDTPYFDFHVRTRDATLIARLRAAAGMSLFDPRHDLVHEIPLRSPHRVFVSALGRIEVYQSIGAPDGATPEGPHTHLLPRLLRSNRTHSANLALPEGAVPCVILYPANPVRDDLGNAKPFERTQHEAFQALMECFGEPALMEVKRAVWAAVRRGAGTEAVKLATRRERLAARIALRQMLYTDDVTPALAQWRDACESAAGRSGGGAAGGRGRADGAGAAAGGPAR